MDNTIFKLSDNAALAISVGDADRLITLGSGNAALLYIYALRCGSAFSVDKAAAALRKTEGEIRSAAELLATAGVFSSQGGGKKAAKPLPGDETPEYTSADMVRRSTEDGEFKLIVEETQHILGHTLTSQDLKILFELYDQLSLPPEVIFLLLNHCTEETRSRLGSSARVSMRAVQKEGYYWFNHEIITLERVENYLQQRKNRKSAAAEIKHVLQINGRELSASEQKFIDDWLDMGFSPELIALAYDKTIMKTGKLAWSYMNTILQSWHQKGLHTAEAVESGDKPSARAGLPARSGSPSASGRADDSALLRELLSKSKNKN